MDEQRIVEIMKDIYPDASKYLVEIIEGKERARIQFFFDVNGKLAKYSATATFDLLENCPEFLRL